MGECSKIFESWFERNLGGFKYKVCVQVNCESGADLRMRETRKVPMMRGATTLLLRTMGLKFNQVLDSFCRSEGFWCISGRRVAAITDSTFNHPMSFPTVTAGWSHPSVLCRIDIGRANQLVTPSYAAPAPFMAVRPLPYNQST